MPFKMEQNEIDRLPNLPKWAQDMITRMGRLINMREQTISELTMGDDVETNVSIAKWGGDKPLPQNSKIEFKLPDSMLTHKDKEYRERNKFVVSIKDDVYNGGKLLEIHAEASIIVETQASNVIHIRPRNTVQKNFIGFATEDSEDVEA